MTRKTQVNHISGSKNILKIMNDVITLLVNYLLTVVCYLSNILRELNIGYMVFVLKIKCFFYVLIKGRKMLQSKSNSRNKNVI